MYWIMLKMGSLIIPFTKKHQLQHQCSTSELSKLHSVAEDGKMSQKFCPNKNKNLHQGYVVQMDIYCFSHQDMYNYWSISEICRRQAHFSEY